ncbi:hypothetical protein FB45DRAFT_1004686 [Roridomyces roridus]|uniref:Uncharacterized protein n=1 Tax=Roridomyces roridus TaxID=1738132 RepID=A0AAD7FLV6_9AGAR|nr:hypothetical protein FB45DRAFT_1004686 [Roridomyces roridus]
MLLPSEEDTKLSAGEKSPPPPGYSPAPPASSSSGGSDALRPQPQWPSDMTALSPMPSPSFPSSRPSTPAAFSRSPPLGLSATPFKPMFLIADDNSLKRGFPAILPPSTSTPHPFVQHDVSVADWTQFLDELRTVAGLTKKERALANQIPIISHLPIIKVAVATAISQHIMRKKPRVVSLLVDKWNHHFFHPRNLSIVLMHGHTKLSGQSDTPVANLYTPRTVPSLNAADMAGSSGGAEGEGDKMYRLFVVSLEAVPV